LNDKIEELKQQELARLKNEVENSNLLKFFIGFFVVVIGAVVIIAMLVKYFS